MGKHLKAKLSAHICLLHGEVLVCPCDVTSVTACRLLTRSCPNVCLLGQAHLCTLSDIFVL
jgi:hypothetical protein